MIPAHSASSVETEELVHELRAVTVPVQGSEVSLGIAGQTSGNIDVSEVLAQKLPPVPGRGDGPVLPGADPGVPFDYGSAGCFGSGLPLLWCWRASGAVVSNLPVGLH